MKEVQHATAISMVKAEFNRLAMCKRGAIETEQHQRRQALNEERVEVPHIDDEDMKVLFKKNRKSLLKMLKFKGSDQIYIPGTNRDYLYTLESRDAYRDAIGELYKHPDYDAAIKNNNAIDYKQLMLQEEMQARNAYLDAEVNDLILRFVTGAIDMINLSSEVEKFEAYAW